MKIRNHWNAGTPKLQLESLALRIHNYAGWALTGNTQGHLDMIQELTKEQQYILRYYPDLDRWDSIDAKRLPDPEPLIANSPHIT